MMSRPAERSARALAPAAAVAEGLTRASAADSANMQTGLLRVEKGWENAPAVYAGRRRGAIKALSCLERDCLRAGRERSRAASGRDRFVRGAAHADPPRLPCYGSGRAPRPDARRRPERGGSGTPGPELLQAAQTGRS